MKFATTGSKELPSHLKILLTGPAKSGKTSFVGTIPNVLIADTEPFANNLQSVAHLNVPFTPITSSDDLRQLLLILRDEKQRQKIADDLGIPAIEAVAIDTLDSFQEILKAERLKETRQSSFKRDDWSWLLETMSAIVTSFCALPLHVVFAVHTKIQNLGTDDDPRSIILPALNGQMAERIAGMVGYSLATFRKEEIGKDGAPRTVYWLRTEGDEVHPHLGNRSAGRLPSVIAPSFQAIVESLPTPTEDSTPVETIVEEAAPQETPDVPSAGELEPEPQQAVEAEAGPEPLSAAAVSHLAKVWKALDRDFNEDYLGDMSLDQAREIVVMWEAMQVDFAEGKLMNPHEQMTAYLITTGWLPEPSDDEQLAASLALPEPEPADEPAPAPEPQPEAVEKPKRRTRKVAAKSEPVAAVTEQLGGKVIDIREGASQAPCDECGKPIDDADIAALAVNRFSKWLCVDDYTAASRAAKAN